MLKLLILKKFSFSHNVYKSRLLQRRLYVRKSKLIIALWGLLTADLSTSIKLDHAAVKRSLSVCRGVPLGLQRSTLIGSGRGFYTDFFDMSTKSV